MNHKNIFNAVTAKWEHLVKHPGADCFDLERIEYEPGKYLDDFEDYNECGYCYIFYDNDCKGCPLNLTIEEDHKDAEWLYDPACVHPGHPYMEYREKPTSNRADKVLDLIKITKEKFFNTPFTDPHNIIE